MAGDRARSSGAKPARSTRANAGEARQRGQGGTTASRSGPAPVHLSDIYRGYPRLALIRDLAFGEYSYSEIAKTMGCTAGDISLFAQEHVQEIAEVRVALAGKLAIESAGLWVSKKQNRLAELQSDIEDLKDYIEDLRPRGGSVLPPTVMH